MSLDDASLREKLKKIMASDNFTTSLEMKAPVEVAAAAGNYISFQILVDIEASSGHYQQKDTQNGLDLGRVSPEVLQNLFDFEQYPLISELTQWFQGFRERLLDDPKFLNRLAIKEAISITTTLIAQYEKRKENLLIQREDQYFFTVWLPTPTLSFLSYADETTGPESIEALRSLLGSIPDNAFQKF